MTTFLFIAAVMAVIAAAAVAWPLIRNRHSRVVGAVAAVIVIGAAAGLYPLWSNWKWHPPQQAQSAGPDVSAMVAKLEKRLRDEPKDLAGWLMLGRSYVVLERFDDAIIAYDHAHRLDDTNVEAALGLGEAMTLRNGSEITAPAAQLFEQALLLAPENPQALLYGGFAAAARGDGTAARSRWQALKGLHPPPQIEEMLDARIAELRPSTGNPVPEAGVAKPNAPPNGSDATLAPPGNAVAAEATVNIRIAPALKARLTAEAPLFVFAREPGSQGPPLAAKRLNSLAIGTQIRLSPADSMMPGHSLVVGQRISITARVSFSGQPSPSAGDLYGELSYDVGRDGVRNLLIDRVAE